MGSLDFEFFDSGGLRFCKMLKRMKKVSLSYGYEEVDAQTKSEFQRWKQEYNELLTATKVKKKNLQKAKKRRGILRAEVQFLRQRYEYLMSIQSPTPLLVRDLPRNQVPQTHEVPLPKERIYRDREVALPNCTPVIDLNQISTEEEEQLQIQNVAEPLRMENNLVKFPISSRGGKPPLPPRPQRSNVKLSSDMPFSVCRELGKGSSQTGKRKISWQDPVAFEGLTFFSLVCKKMSERPPYRLVHMS